MIIYEYQYHECMEFVLLYPIGFPFILHVSMIFIKVCDLSFKIQNIMKIKMITYSQNKLNFVNFSGNYIDFFWKCVILHTVSINLSHLHWHLYKSTHLIKNYWVMLAIILCQIFLVRFCHEQSSSTVSYVEI